MTRGYVLRRILQLVPTAAAILLVGFLLIHLAPGDPVLALAGENGDAEYYALVREKFGLDEPLPAQLATYAGNILTGDLGTSYVLGRPVRDVIAERLPATLLLTSSALGISTVLGIAGGVFTATRHRRGAATAVTVTTLAMYAAPAFLVGQLAILLLALRLGLFPVQGMSDARSSATGTAQVFDVAHHLVLPTLALAAQEIAAVSRLSHVALVEEMGRDHIRTARAKGLPERTVVLRHGLRRAMLPVVTVLGGRVGHLVAGAVVIEVVFGWPGLGRLLVTSMQSRDTPVVLGVFLLVAATVVVANLLTDLVYALLDPRVRFR